MVRLPVNVYELLSKINKVASRLNAQPGRQKPATYNEIGEPHVPQQGIAVDVDWKKLIARIGFTSLWVLCLVTAPYGRDCSSGLHSANGLTIHTDHTCFLLTISAVLVCCSQGAGPAGGKGHPGGARVAGGQEPRHACRPVGQP